jgi:hypothetical protein
VHKSVVMQGSYRLANLPKYFSCVVFAEVATLDFFKEGAPVGVFKYHVSYILLFLVVEVHKLNNIGVVEALVNRYLFLGVFVIDLNEA